MVPLQIMRLPAVAAKLGLSKSTIERLRRLGEFPDPIRIAPRCIGWPEAAVDAWLRARSPEPDPEEQLNDTEKALVHAIAKAIVRELRAGANTCQVGHVPDDEPDQEKQQ